MMTEPDDTPWLHIYGQYMWHDGATIRGSRAALLILRDAIDSALEGKEATTGNVFAADGEGYQVTVQRTTLMAELGTPEYRFFDEYAASKRAAERASEFGLKAAPQPNS